MNFTKPINELRLIGGNCTSSEEVFSPCWSFADAVYLPYIICGYLPLNIKPAAHRNRIA